MKKLIFIFLTICSSLSLSAQEWAPVGAKWDYDIFYAFMPQYGHGTAECISSYTQNGKDIRVIKLHCASCPSHFCGTIETFEQNDTIFFFNPDIMQYQVLYDFGAESGDHWDVYVMGYDSVGIPKLDTATVYVDSVDSIPINGMTLRRLHLEYKYNFNTGSGSNKSVAIEKIGDVNLLFNFQNDDPRIICDMDFLGPLRCYSDNELGQYSTGLRKSCEGTIYVGLNDIKELIPFDIYPNPTYDHLSLDYSENLTLEYTIHDSQGKCVKQGMERKINLIQQPSGIYIIRLRSGNGEVISKRFIKK